MQPDFGDVGARALGDAALCPVFQIKLHEGRRVATERTQKKRRVGTRNDDRTRAEAVRLGVAQKALPARRRASQKLPPAILERAQRQARSQLQILKIAGETLLVRLGA